MADNPIVIDTEFLPDLIESTQMSIAMLSTNAQKTLDLLNALSGSSQIAYSKMYVDTFIASRADWLSAYSLSAFGSTNVGVTANSIGHYGNIYDYSGNLDTFYITLSNRTSPNNPPYSVWHTSSLSQSAYTLSAGPRYYGTSPHITFTTPTTSVLTSILKYHANRYSFVCQYLWANPVNESLATTLATLTAVQNYNVKFGVNSTYMSLINGATGLQQDVIFYNNKQTYLTTLI